MPLKIIRRANFLLFSVIILAFILRLAAVLRYGDFWDDEMFNFIYSQRAWPEGLKWWLWETNPPLHLLLLKIWFLFLPANEFFARLPSLIFGTASVYYIYKIGKDFFPAQGWSALGGNERVGLLAAFYLAVHPYHIFWSATARIYALLMLLVLLSARYFYLIFFTENKSRKILFLYGFTNLLLLFSHLTALPFLSIQFIILLATRKNLLIKWCKLNAAPFLIGGGWILASFIVKSGNNLKQSWFLNIQHTFWSALTPIFNLVGGQMNHLNGLIFSLTALILILAALGRQKNISSQNYLVVLSFALLPPIFAAATGLWHIKFFLIALPFFVLSVTAALEVFFRQTIFILTIILFAAVPGLLNLYRTLPLSDWRQINNYIAGARQDGKKQIFLYNNFILRRQIERYLPDLSIPSVPFNVYDGLNPDEMVTKKNYILNQYPQEKISAWLEKEHASQYDEIILLEWDSKYMADLKSALLKNGWTKKKGPDLAHLSDNYFLYIYENPLTAARRDPDPNVGRKK